MTAAPAALARESSADSWTPFSWRVFPMDQAVEYADGAALEACVAKIEAFPPLVSSFEIERLRGHLAEAAEGRRFVLQGGDCAETLAECNSGSIANKLKILLQMSLVLTHSLRQPIIRMGRFAGQYAKPRSSPVETRGDAALPSYFGDLINRAEFTPEARRPDPQRLVECFHHAALTLNFIRALIDGGFADLHHPEYWDLNFLGKAGLTPDLRGDYVRRVGEIARAIEMMEVVAGRSIDKLSTVEFYTSHEALSLNYEAALTRTVPRRAGHYNLGCHLPWIGERTRRLDGAHVEYMRGIRNPIGIKLGPKATTAEVQALIERLDPCGEPGRIVLIGRFGAGRVRAALPRLVEAARATGRKPVWLCDPMHGNTETVGDGTKTRRFSAILQELVEQIEVHEELGGRLGGVHIEHTAEAVTECLGGASGVSEADLHTCYQTLCDPRLNYEQAMELAFAIAKRME